MVNTNGRGHRINTKLRELARELIQQHFPKKNITIDQLSGGLTNFVFAAKAGREDLVVRISDQADKINYFMKEQWATSQARAVKIPVPEILEVGNSIIPLPYMISRKIEGDTAVHHPNRLDILYEMGKLSAAIHRIPTQGFGKIFDWSHNSLSKNDNWKIYLRDELKARERIDILWQANMLTDRAYKRLKEELNKIADWKGRTCLQHGDLRLKNIMVNTKGHITAIIDWEECISSIGPLWDISIALHDLSIDGQQQFLDGYGMGAARLIKESAVLKTFNLINYAPVIADLVKQKDKTRLAHYKARLHGALDLFSL